MDCWARINGKDYPIATGWTLSEEFSETLDSASVNLPHVLGKIELKPYDDVLLHDYDPNSDDALPNRPYGQVFVPQDGHFYRHMLVGSFTEELLSLVPNDDGQYVYNYALQLISETKGLETVQLPNRTISQPMGTGERGAVDDVSTAKASFVDGNFALPYSVSSWENGLLLGYYTEQDGLFNTQVTVRLFAGDIDTSTPDFSGYTAMESRINAEKDFRLPDWNISSVCFLVRKSKPIGNAVLDVSYFHPKKHWIVRKVGTYDNLWDSKASAVARIKSYIDDGGYGDYPEIVNLDVCGQRIVSSEEPLASIVGRFPALQNPSVDERYVIYLYAEPEKVTYQYRNATPNTRTSNVFGMTIDGMGVPTEDDEFLLYWETVCTDQDNMGLGTGVRSVYEAVRQAVELYSPYIKVTDDGETWRYVRKYSLSPNVKGAFQFVVAPENQWSVPSLRDYITRLFYVADCIPVVHDNVIDCMDLSKRNGYFDVSVGALSYPTRTMDGNSYCDRLLRSYSDGLSRNNVCKCIDRVGFKNMNSSTLTLNNLEIELSHPIYRMRKIYMCYYNAYEDADGNTKMALCKHDITPLVLLDSVRNLLSEDWTELTWNPPTNIKELAKLKYATIGYSIGSKTIGGWGTKYSTPKNLFWKATKTVIENIFEFVRTRDPQGVVLDGSELDGSSMSVEGEFSSNAAETRVAQLTLDSDGNVDTNPFVIGLDKLFHKLGYGEFFGNYTQRLKSLMFEIEYDGYVTAAVIASKDAHDGNIVTRDNASSSLSFMESDGINQKEKVNRLGNATLMISGRYADYGSVPPLASVLENEEVGYVDEVMYKKTVSFNKDYFTASFSFCSDYVLRNYFTSVFSKHRPFPLASYEESVERVENRTLQLVFSSKEQYFQEDSKRIAFSFDVGKLLSFYVPSQYDSEGYVTIENGVDQAYYAVYPSETKRFRGQTGIFASDVQKFTSGNSLCFVVSMKDSVSAGVYTSDPNKNVLAYVGDIIKNTWQMGFETWEITDSIAKASNLLTGAKQDWFMFPSDPKSGLLYGMSFGVGFKTNDTYGTEGMTDYSLYDIAQAQLMPLLDAVLLRAGNMEKPYLYFGQYIEGEGILGGGYPNLTLERYVTEFGAQKYKAIVNDAYASYDSCVIEMSPMDPIVGFIEHYNYSPIKNRQRITEFLAAKFVASETDESEENEVCVFKDGKEKIVMTLQVEPVSIDKAIMFSPYMMRLSDALGGMEKNYDSSEIVNEVSLLFGVSVIRYWETKFSGNDTALEIVLNVPTLTIGVPYGTEPADVEIEQSFVAHDRGTRLDYLQSTDADPNDPDNWRADNGYNRDHTPYGGDGVDYRITVHEILSVSRVNGTLLADCSISYGGTDYPHQTVTFHSVGTGTGTIEGRTQSSTFGVADTCYLAGGAYDSYAMCEDAFFLIRDTGGADPLTSHNNAYVYPTDFSGFTHIRAGCTTNDSLAFVEVFHDTDEMEGNIMPYGESFLEYDGLNYKLRTLEKEHGKTDYLYLDSWNGPRVATDGPAIGEPTTKLPNMAWVISNTALDVNTPYETVAELQNVLAFDQSDISVTTADGKRYCMEFSLPTALPSSAVGNSLRLYYYDDGAYHFVFGFNIGAKGNEGTDPNAIYPFDADGTKYRIYLSFLDDRSKTVLDAVSGDPSYRVANFADPTESAGVSTAFNKCVKKQ